MKIELSLTNKINKLGLNWDTSRRHRYFKQFASPLLSIYGDHISSVRLLGSILIMHQDKKLVGLMRIKQSTGIGLVCATMGDYISWEDEF